MKILIITPRYYPESFSITNIAEELFRQGQNVTVFTGRPHYGKWKIYDGYENIFHETINGVVIERFKEKPRTKGLYGLVKNYISIYRGFKKKLTKCDEKYDIVLSHVISPIFAVSKVSKYCKKFNVPHLHYGLDLWPESLVATNYCKRNSILFSWIKKISIKFYSSCDYITFSSPSAENYIKDYLKISNIPFKQIYQPCLSKLPPFRKKQSGDRSIHILYCGSITRFTHIDIFIKALHMYRSDKIIFDLVGSGIDEDRLKKLVKDLEMEKSVVFHGRVSVDETLLYYNNADFLLASLFDSCATSRLIPQKVIEYFMHGRPILGMLGGDGRLLINKASNSNIIFEQNSDDACNKLRDVEMLFNDKESYEKCCLENYNFFLGNKRFLLENVVKELIDVADSLIKR